MNRKARVQLNAWEVAAIEKALEDYNYIHEPSKQALLSKIREVSSKAFSRSCSAIVFYDPLGFTRERLMC